jgi:Na+/pantothenate symporter
VLGQRVVPTLTESEQVIPAVAHALLPTVFFAVFAGGLVSAILSTGTHSAGLVGADVAQPRGPDLQGDG